jgi:iron complex outermembrane recepter protein
MIYPRVRSTCRVIVIALTVLCAPAAADAQVTAQIAGTISDQTGAPLPGVRVTMRGVTERTAQTGAAGDFVFAGISAGDYELSAELSGFERTRRTVRVKAGERLTVSFSLPLVRVEETIVTAGKAGERDVQTIPMAITGVSNVTLGRLGTQMLGEAAALAPSVTLSQNTGFGQLTIRGIGTNVVNAGSDPSSAMYLDGVYLARPAMDFVHFLDLDRVEVLRGPQGTLYGRNAVGGAINLISRVPTNDFHASASITAGNFGALRAAARMGGALKRDRVMGSVAFSRTLRDGYVRDLNHPDHPLGADDVLAARGQLRVVINRRTDLLVSSDVDQQEGTPLTFSKVLEPKPGFQFDNPPDLHDVRASTRASTRVVQSGASARLTAAITPSTTLVSLTAFRKLDYEFLVDGDITELNVLAAQQRERQHQLSEEITVAYHRPRLSSVAGMFLFDEFDHQSIRADQLALGIQVRLDPHVDATSRAVFGQATVDLTSRFSATAGIRYTHEAKDIENAGGRYGLAAPFPSFPGTTYGYSDSIAYNAWTPKAGFEMKLPGGALSYVSATRGFKSGGFNPSSTATGRGYAPEWAWSYEAGFKGPLMAGRAKLSVSAFVMDYTNLQVQTPISIGVFDIRNAAEATIRGVEVETTSRIGGGIETGGHVTWLDAKYGPYIAVANNGVTGEVEGKRLNNAPEWAGRFWIEWSGAVGRSRRFLIAADVTAQSSVYFTPFNDNVQRQGPYGLLGARAEYGPADRRWAIAAYSRNLTNTDYITATFGTAPTAFGGRPGPQRQFAVEFTVRR